MTPREMQHLIFLEKCGQTRVKNAAKEMDIPVSYSRHLLEYLTREDYVNKIGPDSYQIVSKGIDAIISEYVFTLNSLEKRITKYLNDKQTLVEEIRQLESRKNDLYKSYSYSGNIG